MPREKQRPMLTAEQQNLVDDNLALAYKFSRKYRPPAYGISQDEWVAECLYRLVIAAAGYKPELGFRFSTYAFHSFRHGMWRLGAMQKRNNQVNSLTETEGYIPGPSIDMDRGRYARAQLETLLPLLDERGASVLRQRMAGMTLAALAEHFKISKERVRQVQASAIQQLNQHIRKNGIQYAG
jgi:RNA polymerase sigma factor (sigma-70 family)